MVMLAIPINLFLLVLSMDLSSLFGNSTVARELGQYPDKRLYNSAAMLKPQDRPNVPVRLFEPDPEKYPIVRAIPNVGGWANAPNGPIMLNQKSEFMKDPVMLASKIAHETQHYKTGYDEIPAYKKEIEVLQNSRWRDSAYVRQLIEHSRKLGHGYEK
jgi:hypothetical protein